MEQIRLDNQVRDLGEHGERNLGITPQEIRNQNIGLLAFTLLITANLAVFYAVGRNPLPLKQNVTRIQRVGL
jgi:hypothetical protein